MPVLHQLSYQANWKQVVMWVDYKLVDGEIQEFSLYLKCGLE